VAMKKQNKGFTLVEVLLVAVMFPVIIGLLAFMFQVVLDSWLAQGSRTGLGVRVTKVTREMVGDLRNARGIGSLNSNEIRFTEDGSAYYIYYLYSAADSYPPDFKESSYQVRKAVLSGAIGGTFAYGSGDLIARDILPPPASGLSFSTPMVTIDLTAGQGNSTTRSVGRVRPRNI
jgi:prepilin-type N-terminal cleavage/methylation domain-containing protein